MSLAGKLFYATLCLLAAGVSAYSFTYALPEPPLAPQLPNFIENRGLLTVHAVLAAVALLLVPLQLSSTLRQRHGQWHCWAGRVYAGCVLASGLVSLPLAFNAQTGLVAGAGFFVLGILWMATTGRGVWLARQRRYIEHRPWMLRSAALAGAAITLRIYIGIAAATGVDIGQAYPTIAWLCWLPNLIAAEAYVRLRPRPGRALLPA